MTVAFDEFFCWRKFLLYSTSSPMSKNNSLTRLTFWGENHRHYQSHSLTCQAQCGSTWIQSSLCQKRNYGTEQITPPSNISLLKSLYLLHHSVKHSPLFQAIDIFLLTSSAVLCWHLKWYRHQVCQTPETLKSESTPVPCKITQSCRTDHQANRQWLWLQPTDDTRT